MKITIAETGYVGLTKAILVAQNNEVIALDIIEDIMDMINDKKSTIADTEIEKYLASIDLNLKAITDSFEAFKDAQYVIISTPKSYEPEKNYFNTRIFEAVIVNVLSINLDAVMIIKSMGPVGMQNLIEQKSLQNFLLRRNSRKMF